MFYVAEAVFSRMFGYGLVIEPGHHPMVRFISGLERRTAGQTLRLVPDEQYDELLANKVEIEQWLHQGLHSEPLADEVHATPARVQTTS